MLKRYYQDKKLSKYLTPNKVVVIYGPRRVGKTTLIKEYLKGINLRYRLDSGENMEIQRILSSRRFDLIKDYASDYQLLVIDEAQHIPNVGMGLKIIVDQIPGIKVIATGSSSFDLSGQVGEPLVGRKWTLNLYPLAQLELRDRYSAYELKDMLDNFLIFGGYPTVLTAKTKKAKRETLEELSQSYLLKDLLSLENIKSPQTLVDMLKLLAFQIGGEVSFNELANQLSIDVKTVERYLELLQKTFVIFRLPAYSLSSPRKVIRSKHKYYFYDNGIRNALVSQFNTLDKRNDAGQLWENFLAVERLKKQEYAGPRANNYFWRAWDGQEVDWVEMRNGVLHGFEFKWGGKKVKEPKDWPNAFQPYGKTTFEVIDKENYLDFLL